MALTFRKSYFSEYFQLLIALMKLRFCATNLHFPQLSRKHSEQNLVLRILLLFCHTKLDGTFSVIISSCCKHNVAISFIKVLNPFLFLFHLICFFSFALKYHANMSVLFELILNHETTWVRNQIILVPRSSYLMV